MDQGLEYNAIIDDVIDRLKLTQNAGVEYIALGPKPALEILFDQAGSCTLCPLYKEKLSTAKINLGTGGLRAELAFVLDTELTDKGEERELLEKMITAMGLGLKDIYITSAVKCVTKEPTENQEALEACKDLLMRELEYVSPSVVVTLGQDVTKIFFSTPLPFDSIRGRFQNPTSRKKSSTTFQVMPTHPLNQLVGDKKKKSECWGDLKKIMERLNLKPAK